MRWHGPTRRCALSLNERELRSLRRIAEELATCTPLMTLLAGFNRLNSGEAMPRRRPLRRLRRRISTAVATRIFLGVWVFMTAAMIATALILSHAGQAEAGAAVHVVAAQHR